MECKPMTQATRPIQRHQSLQADPTAAPRLGAPIAGPSELDAGRADYMYITLYVAYLFNSAIL